MTGTSLSEERHASTAALNVFSSADSESVSSKPTLAMSSGVTGPFRLSVRSLPTKSTSLASPIKW